jgi:threonine synthase
VFESVSDEAFARCVLAKMEGISAEPAAGVAFAGLFKLIRAGVIKPTDTVVVNCTGHTLPAEPYVLGSGWARNVVLPSAEEMPQEEGLLAALNRVAPERFARVAIIDDTADARRLVRRILQSQGDFTISEAANGREGLELVSENTQTGRSGSDDARNGRLCGSGSAEPIRTRLISPSSCQRLRN